MTFNSPAPRFVYDLEQLRRNAASFLMEAPSAVRVLYATMANPRPHFIAAMIESGLGLFVNSTSHLAVALQEGARGADITFAASGNTENEHAAIARAGCTFIADSLPQFLSYRRHYPGNRIGVRLNVASLFEHDLHAVSDPAPRLGLTAEELESLFRAGESPQILHVYVGTNLTSATSHIRVLSAMAPLVERFPLVDEIDLGGGFSRSPADEPAAARMWRDLLDAWATYAPRRTRPLALTVEPGRAIAASAGKLYATVTDVKERAGTRFVVVNTSSTWYPRTLLHNAPDHFITIAGRDHGSTRPAIICGCTTYSNDVLARCSLPEVQAGDLLEFAFAGAYCESMHLDFLGVSPPVVTFATAARDELCSEAAVAEG